MTLYEHCGTPKYGWTTLGTGDYRSKDLTDKGVRINGLTGMKIEGPGDCATLAAKANPNPNPTLTLTLTLTGPGDCATLTLTRRYLNPNL